MDLLYVVGKSVETVQIVLPLRKIEGRALFEVFDEIMPPRFVGLRISRDQSPVIRADPFQIKERKNLFYVVIRDAVEPLVVDERSAVIRPQAFDNRHHVRIRTVIMEGDHVRKFQRANFHLPFGAEIFRIAPTVRRKGLNGIVRAEDLEKAFHRLHTEIVPAPVPRFVPKVPDLNTRILAVFCGELFRHFVIFFLVRGIV